jgi:pimeloyl-ACP methyl ester carboxylesterase
MSASNFLGNPYIYFPNMTKLFFLFLLSLPLASFSQGYRPGYWLTGTAVSSARLYWENKLAFFDIKHITIPVAVSAFPDEIYQVPQTWAQKAFPHLLYYSKLPKGGHFAAWEQPQAFCEEMRASFRSLR